MPSDTEITRLRQLIRRVEDDLNTLDPRDQQDIDDAIQVVRHVRRTVHLGVPTTGHRPGSSGRTLMTGESTDPLPAAWRADSDRRRQKVLDALTHVTTAGEEITVSAVARTAGCRPLVSLPPPRPTRTHPRPRRRARTTTGQSPGQPPIPARRPRRHPPTTSAFASRTPNSPNGCPKPLEPRSSTPPG